MTTQPDQAPDYSHLWNDLPIAERERLMPYMLQIHMRHIRSCKQKAILAHQAYLADMDKQLKIIDEALTKVRKPK